MKSQKLGRGLDALLGEIDEAYENEGTQYDTILEIPLKDIRPNPFQPRKSFNEEALHELSESIKNDGLLQPVVVTEDIDGYVLIAGERRFRASKLAKLKTIRAVVLKSDEHKMRQFALIENIQREELNSIELAQAYNELLKLHEMTHDELAGMIHKSRTHITNTLRLLQLSDKAKKALVEQKITAGHAKILVGLTEKEQQLLVDSIIGQKLSVRDAEKVVKNLKEDLSSSVVHQSKVEEIYDFTDLKSKLEILGVKISTSKQSVTLHFDSEDDINEFIAHIQ